MGEPGCGSACGLAGASAAALRCSCRCQGASLGSLQPSESRGAADAAKHIILREDAPHLGAVRRDEAKRGGGQPQRAGRAQHAQCQHRLCFVARGVAGHAFLASGCRQGRGVEEQDAGLGVQHLESRGRGIWMEDCGGCVVGSGGLRRVEDWRARGGTSPKPAGGSRRGQGEGGSRAGATGAAVRSPAAASAAAQPARARCRPAAAACRARPPRTRSAALRRTRGSWPGRKCQRPCGTAQEARSPPAHGVWGGVGWGGACVSMSVDERGAWVCCDLRGGQQQYDRGRGRGFGCRRSHEGWRTGCVHWQHAQAPPSRHYEPCSGPEWASVHQPPECTPRQCPAQLSAA